MLEQVKFSIKKAFQNFQDILYYVSLHGPSLQLITLLFLVRGLTKVADIHVHVKEKGTILEEQHYYTIDYERISQSY